MSENGGPWGAIVNELERRRSFGRAMGGADRLEKQRLAGKLNARERVDALLDTGSFTEVGALAANLSEGGEAPAPADGLVAGFGTVDGRPVLVAVEDFTVLGGSIGDASAAKRYRIAELAAQERVPLVFMLEGAGHRLTNKHPGRSPNDLQALAELSGLVPMVCLVMGPSAGHGALTAPLSDFVVMTEQGAMFAAGPPVVKGAIGEVVTKEDLGGPAVHVALSGVAHNLAANDREAIDLARRYLSYFPTSAWELPPTAQGDDQGPRLLDDILSLVSPDPRYPFDMRQLLAMLVDSGSLFEVQPRYGGGLVTALARIGGTSVAIVANNPAHAAGAVDSAAALKASHFMEVAQAFHLPVIFLTDNPGIMPGTAAEKAGTLRHAARMFAVQHRLTVPKFHVTLRKAFGFGSSIMAMNPFDGQTLSLAFPRITLGAMPADSGARAAGLDEATRARIQAEQEDGAFGLADKMGFDEVIDPRELRNALLAGLRLSERRRAHALGPSRWSGITP